MARLYVFPNTKTRTVMKKILSCVATVLFFITAAAQSSVTITFACRTTVGHYVQPDSITVENLSKGWSETLLYPDTIYLLNVGTGIPNVETQCFASLQASPNPFKGATTVNLDMTEPGEMTMEIADMRGRVVVANDFSPLQSGRHSFRVILSHPGSYVLTASVNGKKLSAKLMNTGNGGKDALEYSGSVSAEMCRGASLQQGKSSPKGTSQHPFQIGDQMRYVAHASGIVSEDVTHSQTSSEEITLLFSTPPPPPGDVQPCLVTPTVMDYDGNVYNTVQIGSQCWMKENMRATHYSDGTSIDGGGSNSYTIPYYYDFSTSGVELPLRGLLYNWPAAMHGNSSSNTSPSGVQGICPTGWHVPSDLEWTQLLTYLGNQFPYLCDYDSTYIAKSLAATSGWNNYNESCTVGYSQATNNATGFSAYPAGYSISNYYSYLGQSAFFWSSTEIDNFGALARYLNYGQEYVTRKNFSKFLGYSVRCLHD